MAIRKVIECDFCGEEVNGKYYLLRARDFDTLFNDVIEKHNIICEECVSHIRELLIRLNHIKEKKQEV